MLVLSIWLHTTPELLTRGAVGEQQTLGCPALLSALLRTGFAGAAHEPRHRLRPSSALRRVGDARPAPHLTRCRVREPAWGDRAGIGQPAGHLVDTRPFAIPSSHPRSGKNPKTSCLYVLLPAKLPRWVGFPACSFLKCLNGSSALLQWPRSLCCTPDTN